MWLMRLLVEKLLELQELELVVEESRIVHPEGHSRELAELSSRIAALRKSIPGEDLKRYDGHRRSGAGAVRVEGGVCRGCHLAVPVGDLNRMRKGEASWLCPYCGRYLLLPE
jgi:predicted  nucleic acid-binding Zn-ribbon protein